MLCYLYKNSRRKNMATFDEYYAQSSEDTKSDHYDEHTDRWVDEASESVYGHSGHCDVHTDKIY